MPEYTVRWEMDVHADSPREAAEVARRFQRDPTAMVGVFDVYSPEGECRIDLDDDEGEHDA